MPTDDCPSRDRLLAFHRGEAAEAEIDRVSEHLAGCPACEAAADALERTPDAVLSALRLAAPPTLAGPVTLVTPAPAAGDRVGPFRLLEPLGTGGMGVVFRAADDALRREVAVKLLRPEMAHDPRLRQRFLAEARAAAGVRHPNVVDIFQVGEDAGRPFLAMELLPGESLERRLRLPVPLPPAEALRVAAGVARGLAAAHAAGLVHRDVKPDNVFLLPDGGVKLLDFGLARPVDAGDGLTSTGVVVGTPGYMAPEQVKGEPVDARTDLFALGCVLYRLLTGRPAFGGATVLAVLAALETTPPPSPRAVVRAVPRPVDLLVRRLLAKRPTDRPPAAAAVADALEAFAAGRRPAPGGYAAELERAVGWDRRRRLARWAAAAAAAGLAAAGLWAATRPAPPPAPLELAVTAATDDPAPGTVSLRAALEQANSHPGPVVVTFAVDGELTITRILPAVTNPAVEVRGPGADRLTVRPAPEAGRTGIFEVGPGGGLTLADLTVAHGRAKNGGGVLNLGGSLALVRCTVADCVADESGGGVYSAGRLRVDACTVWRNTAWWYGGGVYAGGDGGPFEAAVRQSTLSHNRAKRHGGGLVLHHAKDARVDGCTIAFNRCNLDRQWKESMGGGLRVLDSAVEMTNTVVAPNFRGDLATNVLERAAVRRWDVGEDQFDDLSLSPGPATRLTGGHNLIGLVPADSSFWSGFAGDRLGRPGRWIDPQLGPLGKNGGPTRTHAPLPGSPLIDAGRPADTPPADQRGRPRVVGPAPDIGAVEADPADAK